MLGSRGGRLGARPLATRHAGRVWELGDPRAAEIVLKVRRDYRELNDLDLVRERDEPGPTWVVNTELPPEALAGEMVDEEPAGELETGAG